MRRRKPYRNCGRRLACERLESRELLAADLAITNALLVDIHNNPVSNVVTGERALVRAEWRTTDLSPADQYIVRFEMDGHSVESRVISGQSGTNLSFHWYLNVGYSAPGERVVRITVDGANQVNEANENNNEFLLRYTPVQPDIPQKMVYPVPGVAFEDWTIVNYHDVDRKTDSRSDFRGGMHQYDQHEAWDMTVPTFRVMDAGVPILAAADGVVVEAEDGYFDRQTEWDFSSPDSRRSNYVAIDHGAGWVTYYFHLQRDTVAVEVGQQVTSGQTIGLMGSSGISTDTHLHFGVYRRGSAVEPMYALSDYFVSTIPYQGDLAPSVLAVGISDRNPVDDMKESPNDIREFRTDGDKDPWLWYRMDYVRAGDVFSTDWIRPDGTLHASFNWVASNDVRFFQFFAWRRVTGFVGRWTVISRHQGREIVRETFDVISSGGGPEIDVRQDTTYIIDGRSTPIDFGEVEQHVPGTELTFAIENRGHSPLSLQQLSLPSGFELVGIAPSSIPAGAFGSLQIRLRTDKVGKHWGDVRFVTNDADETEFNFAVEGSVLGTPPATAPVLGGKTIGLALEAGTTVRQLFPNLVLTDADHAVFGGAILTAKIVSGKEQADRLTLEPHHGAGDFAIHRSVLIYQGTPIAVLDKDGSDGELIVRFTSNVNAAAVRDVARGIRIWHQQIKPTSRRRIVEVKLSDPSSLTSNALRRAVFYADASFQHPPELDELPDLNIEEDDGLGPVSLPLQDIDSSLQNLTVSATSSDTSLLRNEDLALSFANGAWELSATLVADAFGSTTIAVLVQDPIAGQHTQSFDLNVQAINDLPTISTITDQAGQFNQSVGPIPFQVGDVETPATELVISAFSSNTSLIDAGGLQLSGIGANRSILLTPKTNQSGVANITIRVEDQEGGIQDEQFQLSVAGDQTPPVLSAFSDLAWDEDTERTIEFTVSDDVTPSDDIQLVASSSNPTLFPAGSLTFQGTGAERTLRLQPALNEAGLAVITVFALDEEGNTARESFNVEVQPVNDPPEFQVPNQLTVSEDADEQVTLITNINAGGEETQPIVFNWTASDPALFESLQILAPDPAGSPLTQLRWKPAPNASGTSTVVVDLTDGGLDANISTTSDNAVTRQTLTIQVTPVNDPPEMDQPNAVQVDEDSGTHTQLLTGINAGGGESQPLRISVNVVDAELIDSASVEFVAASSTAELTWQTAADRFGSTEFVLLVEDGGLDELLETAEDNATTRVTVAVDIEAVNDPPTFTLSDPLPQIEDAGMILEDLMNVSPGPFEAGPVEWSVSAVPRDALSVLEVQPVDAGNAKLRWQTVEDFFGEIELVISLTDGGLDGQIATESDNAVLQRTTTLSVTPVNDAPTQLTVPPLAIQEDLSGGRLVAVTVDDVDLQDEHVLTASDPRFVFDGLDLWVADGAEFDFESEPEIDLVLTATDTGLASVQATVSVTVRDINEPPTGLQISSNQVYQEILEQSIGELQAIDEDSGQSHSFESRDPRFVMDGNQLQLAPGASLDPSVGNTTTVLVRVLDTGTPALSSDLTIVLDVTAVDSPWQNPITRFDVNADSFVSPIDALFVINYLNNDNPNSLTPQNSPPLMSGAFWDTSGDRFVSSLDALLVINFLNSNGGEGEYLSAGHDRALLDVMDEFGGVEKTARFARQRGVGPGGEQVQAVDWTFDVVTSHDFLERKRRMLSWNGHAPQSSPSK